MTATSQALGEELRSVNPATLEPVGSVLVTTPAEVGDAVAGARLAQERWVREGPAGRRRLLAAAARELLAAKDDIAATITAETGKPRLESFTTEVFVGLDHLVWLERNLERTLRPERVRNPQLHLKHKRGRLRYDPYGVVGVIAPWNFPFSIPFTQAATALAAGNSVVVKPAEQTPLSGAWVEEIFRRAGAPDGLVRVVQGLGETVGDAVARSRGIGKLLFTGSGEVGRIVATRAAERLCPVTLELGGKDPMLVLDDADLERAVEGALWGAFSNCGQVCAGVERIYVARPLHDAFVARLAERAAALRIGRGEDPDVELGPLISEEQRAKVESLVADALENGAEAVTGGRRPQTGLPGWFFQPTVLTGVGPERRIQTEEIFGPVVTVASVDNDDEAIGLANDSRYGLGASVWTRDRARARRVSDRLEAGTVWMNDALYSFGACQAPWGGRKESGYGRTHSKHGLYDLSQIGFSDTDAGRLRPPWWYPYDERAVDGFRGTLEALYGDGLRRRAAAAWRNRGGLLVLGRRALRRR